MIIDIDLTFRIILKMIKSTFRLVLFIIEFYDEFSDFLYSITAKFMVQEFKKKFLFSFSII
jgi:hypothetical protein